MKKLDTSLLKSVPTSTWGGILAIIGVLLLLFKFINATEFLGLIGSVVTIISIKQGGGPAAPTTDDSPAPALVPATNNLPGLLLVLFSLALGSASSNGFARPLALPSSEASLALALAQSAPAASTVQHVLHFGDVRPAVPLSDAVLDTLQGATAPYLVAPPAHLSKRERRQFLRAQRRALRDAARTGPAKIKLAKGAAYNAAPDGVAVAQKNIDAPVGLGPNSPATDNSKLGQHANGAAAAGRDFAAPLSGATAPPKAGFITSVKTGFLTLLEYLPEIFAVLVIGGLLCVRFSPFGRAVVAARSRLSQAV